jgi:ribosome recycling factor
MSDKNIKQMRGQIRQVVKELLPEILKEELTAKINKDLMSRLDQRLDAITNHIKTALDAIDKRAKEVASYVVRNAK